MKRLTDPSFKWISSASHDADSQPFRERQKARIAAADKARAEAKASKVQPITGRKKTS